MQQNLYIPPKEPLKTLKTILAALETEGYDTDNVRIGITWEEFLSKVPDRTTIVVYSVDFFPSLIELLACLSVLQEREIALKSLQEPWLSSQTNSTTELLLKLRELALLLHQNRTQQGLAKARAAGKRIGRPRKALR